MTSTFSFSSAALQLLVAQRRLSDVEPTLHFLFGIVDCRASRGALFGGQRTERLQLRRERAFFAEESHTHFIERRGITRAGNRLSCVG